MMFSSITCSVLSMSYHVIIVSTAGTNFVIIYCPKSTCLNIIFRFFRSLMLFSYKNEAPTHSLNQSYFLVWLSSVRFIETLPLKTSSDSSVHSLLVSLVCLDWMFLFNLSFQFWWKYLSMSSRSRALLSMSDDEHINVKLI